MTHAEISQVIGAAHLYGPVSDDDYATKVLQNHFMTFVNGDRYVGSDDPIEALAAQELVA